MAFDPPHSYAGDLTAVLIAPNGLKTSLFSALYYGGAGGNLVGPYLFSDTAPATPTFESEATNSSVAPPGHYRASGYSDPLITPTFASLGNANGTWILRVRDFCSGDVGSISAATLFVTTTGVAPDGDGDGIPDATDDCPGKAGVAPSGCPDTQAPDTAFLTTPPHGVAKRLTVPFGFVSTEAGSTYQCSLDGSAFAGCPNPTVGHRQAGPAHVPGGRHGTHPATSTPTRRRRRSVPTTARRSPRPSPSWASTTRR